MLAPVPSVTVENYLKRILLLGEGRDLVSMGALAEAMEVTPGTVTSMAKALAAEGWVEHRPRGGVRLTERGRRMALNVVRRHRLVETFLVKTLGMDWADVHAEAEELEHAISERLLGRIDAALGHPKTDPHGDPIPSAQGAVSERAARTLVSFPVQVNARVLRVRDQSAMFLALVEKLGLKPGARVRVLERDLVSGVVQLGLRDGSRQPLGLGEAGKIEVYAG
jgi:DtxR family Mn-dependent transcriptional regulator